MSNHRKTTQRSAIRRQATRLVVLSAAAGTLAVAGAGVASAASIANVTPPNGASSTSFAITLPSGAACSQDSATGNFRIGSYVVNNATVPVSAIPTAINFSTGEPSQGAVLFSTGGVPYEENNTLPATGTVPPPPPFSWTGYANADFNFSGADLNPGTYNVGIACINASGAIDGNNFWNEQFTFTALASNSQDFTWSTQPAAQTPETPLAVGLPLSALALGGGAAFVLRRRKRSVSGAA